jgi:hypothetical protein
VQDLVTYIETIEKDLPYELNPVMRGHVLYDALLPELQTEVMREAKEVTSREQILLIAQRHEEILRDIRKREAGFKPAESRSRPRGATSGLGRKPSEQPQELVQSSEQATTRKDKSQVKCYNCGKLGHFKNDCRAPLKGDAGMAKNLNDLPQ